MISVKAIVLFIAFSFFELIVFVLVFSYIKNNTLPAKILTGEKTTVGLSHYFGYPFLSETILFVVFLFLPIIFFLILKKFKVL